ncbi:hypothetical protein THIOM_001255 [Candidatus Thiomargarita nelsonii]|uniref:Uncharacterized protein n=1 Tax=Candidatus Thiomargarita nelsonii TaxID=1003181 RepID=A0A176S480_9GAMM|nr:hypothetical protein THIOM_001255 [Candidatus Thiomargarita nelsonii]
MIPVWDLSVFDKSISRCCCCKLSSFSIRGRLPLFSCSPINPMSGWEASTSLSR